jgi:outer membrane putative beta-barrel porin/alpha-amylase
MVSLKSIFSAYLILSVFGVEPAQAHEPIFTPGAHVSAKKGKELSLEFQKKEKSGAGVRNGTRELALEYTYGISANWAVKVEVPLVSRRINGAEATAIGDITLGTKYRFSRIDSPGAQLSTTVMFQAKLPTGTKNKIPPVGSGSTDITLGLLHGLESRRWYYNMAARYRMSSSGNGGLKKGGKLLLDVVGGIRPVLSGYKEPDTVFFLEANFESSGRDSASGIELVNTGGWELFLSPGVFWTYRNYAIIGGIQIPIAERLNGIQPKSDYRVKLATKYSF